MTLGRPAPQAETTLSDRKQGSAGIVAHHGFVDPFAQPRFINKIVPGTVKRNIGRQASPARSGQFVRSPISETCSALRVMWHVADEHGGGDYGGGVGGHETRPTKASSNNAPGYGFGHDGIPSIPAQTSARFSELISHSRSAVSPPGVHCLGLGWVAVQKLCAAARVSYKDEIDEFLPV